MTIRRIERTLQTSAFLVVALLLVLPSAEAAKRRPSKTEPMKPAISKREAPRVATRSSTAEGRTRHKPSGRHGGGSYYRSSRGHRYYYPHHYYPYSFSLYYRSHSYPYYYPYGYPPYGHYRPAAYDLGAIDLNVKPKKAEVFLDGEYVGTAGEFDGFPGYLWLERGTYQLVFFLGGYETTARTVTIRPGLVIDLKLRLPEGAAAPPEDHFAEVAPAAAVPDVPSERGVADVRREPGRLHLRVSPEDASIYLDGRFLGTGDELGRLRDGLLIGPGEHTLEVVRPGLESDAVEFVVEAGRDVDLAIDLAR